MNSTLAKGLVPFIAVLFWILSIFLFLRGHNFPGGGFIGALCFVLGFLALSFVYSQPVELFRRFKKYHPVFYTVGLFCLIFPVLVPLLLGREPMTGLWSAFEVPIAGKLSSILIFDLGVYLIVLTAGLSIFDSIFEENYND